MRSINTLEWHAGQASVPLESLSLKNTFLVRTVSYALQALWYVPSQLNRFLDSLDSTPEDARKKSIQLVHQSMQGSRHQHIPSRVWQRRSTILVMLEEQSSARPVVLEKHTVANTQPPRPMAIDRNSTSGSFNVVQVKGLPIWSTNFFDLDVIEH